MINLSEYKLSFVKQTEKSAFRHVGIRDSENMQYLNVVLQLMVNVIPFSYYFLHLIPNKIIDKNCHLAIHMNNFVHQMWHGEETIYTPWDLLNIFQLNYLSLNSYMAYQVAEGSKYKKPKSSYIDTKKHENPVEILKFILEKLRLELNNKELSKEDLSFVFQELNLNRILVKTDAKTFSKSKGIDAKALCYDNTIICKLFETIRETVIFEENKAVSNKFTSNLISHEITLPDIRKVKGTIFFISNKDESKS